MFFIKSRPHAVIDLGLRNILITAKYQEMIKHRHRAGSLQTETQPQTTHGSEIINQRDYFCIVYFLNQNLYIMALTLH